MKITEKMLNSLPKPTERLQALENNIMEKLFDEKISRQVLNTKHTNTMHDKTNNSDITLINRAIDKMENTKDASVFDIPKEEIIENTIMDFIPAITIWLTNESNETLTMKVRVNFIFTLTITIKIYYNTITNYESDTKNQKGELQPCFN